MGSEPLHFLQTARTGDTVALGKLLDCYARYLHLLAEVQIGKRMQSKVDAGDLVQETFLEAHRHFERFQGNTEGQFLAWLRQILAGVLSNCLRRFHGTQARDVLLERELSGALDQSSVALEQALVAHQSSPSQQAARREQAVLLADAMDELPADYRLVLILRHLEGLTFPEVAQRMTRSVDSVEKLWLRAVRRMRRSFGVES